MPLDKLVNKEGLNDHRNKINAAFDKIDEPNEALVTATGTTTPRTLGDWTEKEILSYNSIADAKADTKLDVGRRVKTYGYYTAGDGGGAEYIVEENNGQTPANGVFAAGTNQLRILTDSGCVFVESFGANSTIDSSSSVADASLFASTKKTYISSKGTIKIENKTDIRSSISDLAFVSNMQTEDHVFEVVGGNNLEIKRVTGDCQSINNGTKAFLNVKLSDGITVSDCKVSGIHSLGISIVACNDAKIINNHLTKHNPDGSYVNIGINISEAGDRICDNTLISGNTCDGFGIQTRGVNGKITKNTVRNWKFGGGITLTPLIGAGYNIVSGNTIHDSIGVDVDSTPPAGVECSQINCKIYDNIIFNTAGEGITSASENGRIEGNTIFNSGREPTSSFGNRDSIHLRSVAASSGNSQTVSNNTLFDNQSTKTTQLGIRENPGLTGTFIGSNTIRDVLNSKEVLLKGSGLSSYTASVSANYQTGNNLQILGGSITVSRGIHKVDTEGNAPADDLLNIQGFAEGYAVILHPTSFARTVTVKASGGNIKLNGNADFVFAGEFSTLSLVYLDGFWRETGRSNI